MTGAILAVLALTTTPTAWPELPIAEARIGAWRLSAATYVDASENPPTIMDIRCAVRRPGFSLLLSRYGGAEVFFGGDGTGFSLHDVKAVTIDAARWQARRLPLAPAQRYADVSYPDGHPTSLGVADEYFGIRRSEEEPWLHLSSLVNELAEGRMLRVEHESGTYALSLAGLKRALSWCTSVMQSEGARRFRRPARD